MVAGSPYDCLKFEGVDNSTTERYKKIILNLRVAVSSLSFLGSLFVILLIWLFKKYKFFVQRMILYLSISAFISSFAYILGRVEYPQSSGSNNTYFCQAGGFFLLYSDWTVVLSILCITTNLLISVNRERTIRGIEWLFVSIIFLLPLPIVCIPLYHKSFGPAGAWCWIRSKNSSCGVDETGEYLQFAVWYIPQYSLIVVLFLMYITTVIKVKLKSKQWEGLYDANLEYRKALIHKEVKPLFWYPTLYLLITVMPLINRSVSSATKNSYFPLFLLHVLTSPLQGALIALVYALDRDTLQRLRWSNIKASFKYRNTDNIVKEYVVGPSMDESHPFLSSNSTSSSVSFKEK